MAKEDATLKIDKSQDNIVIASPENARRVICPVHGDIGPWGPDSSYMNAAETLVFSITGQKIFCLYCVEELLLKAIKPCELKNPTKDS